MWGGGTVPPNTMNVAVYLQLLALFILTSSQCEIPCPNDFRDKHQRGSTKTDNGSNAPSPHTAQHGVVIVGRGKYQPKAKRQKRVRN